MDSQEAELGGFRNCTPLGWGNGSVGETLAKLDPWKSYKSQAW